MKVKELIRVLETFDQASEIKVFDVDIDECEIISTGVEQPVGEEPFVFLKVE